MSNPLKWVLLLVVTIRAEDPRKRSLLICQNHDIPPINIDSQKFLCIDPADGKHFISKRFAPEGIEGPFWANRGKKDHVYMSEPLFAEEPYWVIIRGDNGLHEDPFFLSRGKKETGTLFNTQIRDTREFLQDSSDAPFFAARGKRFKMKH